MLRAGNAATQLGPGDLLVHVAAEVPRHRLQPGQRVRRGPRLRVVVGALERQNGVLEAEAGSAVSGQVRVHTAGVVVEVLPGGRAEQAQLLLRDPAPAERADELVRLECVLAEQLAQPAGGDVPAEVHLEEPVLCVHVALRGEQVGRGVGVDLRDAVRVPDDVDVAVQAGQLDRSVVRRERVADDENDGSRDHQEDRGEGDSADDDDSKQATHGPNRRESPRRAPNGVPHNFALLCVPWT